MEKRLGIAVVGTGQMGARHLDGWQQVPGAEIVAIADVDLGRAREAAASYSVPLAVADYRQAIDRPDVDVVSICTSSFPHWSWPR